MQVFHGVDLVEISSFEKLLADPENHFLTRCFLPSEVTDAGTGPNRSAKLAARFAAKEAVMKALGTGFSAGIGFQDIRIESLGSGAPIAKLQGNAAAKAEALGISAWALSTSHDGGYAIASVIGYGVIA
jgi:holo-[acyl-carrier protein] synthase